MHNFEYIKVNNGLIKIDKLAKIKENTNTFIDGFNCDYYYNTLYKKIARIGDITKFDFKIIEATSNLNLENIPNIQENNEYLIYLTTLHKQAFYE